MREVLIVVDMQNDFVHEKGALNSQAAREIVPFIRSLVETTLKKGKEVVFTLDTHYPDDAEFDKFPPHCLEGSWGQKLIPELENLLVDEVKEQIHFVHKNRYSAFFQTDLGNYLGLEGQSAQEKVGKVKIVGVCTNICVFFTAEELANRDIPTVVYAQGVASFDLNAHINALEQMQSVLGVEIIS